MIGETLGTYQLIEKLGEGGMGEVYRAHDEMLDRDVALKMLRPELARRPQTAERFRAEAITLAKLDHPGIARIHGASRHGDLWFIVMEYVRGETLQARLHRAGRLHWTEIVPILRQLLDALEYAHRLGVIHRDMKPANVLIGPDGRVKVTDFGIARVLGTERATRTGHVVGTLEYMAPEQVRGEEVDGRTDLYAVGIMLYELLTGRTPFSGSAEYEVMMQHLQAPIPTVHKLAADAPAWFDGILRRALAKARADRFATATEFQGAIETLASGEAALQIRPTRLAIAKATQPEPPPGPTRLAPGPPAMPQTRLASGAEAARAAWGQPAAAAPPVLPPPPVPAPTPATRSLSWRQMTAAGAVLVVLGALGIVGIRRVLGHPVEVTAANAGKDAPPPTPKPAILDAPDSNATAPPGPLLPGPPPDTVLPPSGGKRISIPLTGASPGASAPRGAPAAGGPSAGPTPAPGPAPASAPVESPAPPPARAEEAAPAPAAAEANAIEVDEVALIVGEGGDREEKEVIVRFESQRLVLRDSDSEKVIRALPYRAIEATYARARNPVGKAERDRPAFVRGLAKAGGLFRRTPHWLTLEGSGAPVVFKLDGGQAEKIVGLLEGRANVKVERISEK